MQWAQAPPPAGQARGTLRALARELEVRGIVSCISYETVRRVLKNKFTFCNRMQRCYPSVPEADFVIPMEAVLDLYSQPCDARYPVICMDEQPQPLRADKRPPQPARPGHPTTYAYAYVRCGTCILWMFVEPLAPWRTAVDWVRQVKALADHPRYRLAERLIRVCDPSEHPHLCLLFPDVYAPARPLAQQGRTGTERPDTAGPVPAHGHAGRGPRAGHRLGGGPQRRPKGHPLAVPHRRCPRAPQTSVPYNRNMMEC